MLLQRLDKMPVSLSEIPGRVGEKKWSKVTDILTGPMCSLGSTMDQLSEMSENEEQLCSLEKAVKNDLYAIIAAAAADRKNGDLILKLYEKATNDLGACATALS